MGHAFLLLLHVDEEGSGLLGLLFAGSRSGGLLVIVFLFDVLVDAAESSNTLLVGKELFGLLLGYLHLFVESFLLLALLVEPTEEWTGGIGRSSHLLSR